MKVKKTCRGFEIAEFTDIYGAKCSLQQSSLADRDAIWLGIDDPEPKCLHGDAKGLGVITDVTCGWVPCPISPKISLTTRMHLDRNKVTELILHLQGWLRSGSICKNKKNKLFKGKTIRFKVDPKGDGHKCVGSLPF